MLVCVDECGRSELVPDLLKGHFRSAAKASISVLIRIEDEVKSRSIHKIQLLRQDRVPLCNNPIRSTAIRIVLESPVLRVTPRLVL
jgi:hypothetical protein